MKLTKEQFKLYILSEVKKLGQAEGWLPRDETPKIAIDSAPVENTTVLSENSIIAKDTETIISETPAIIDEKITVSDVKKLNEEFKRMKHLVDFRSPLLMKD